MSTTKPKRPLTARRGVRFRASSRGNNREKNIEQESPSKVQKVQGSSSTAVSQTVTLENTERPYNFTTNSGPNANTFTNTNMQTTAQSNSGHYLNPGMQLTNQSKLFSPL